MEIRQMKGIRGVYAYRPVTRLPGAIGSEAKFEIISQMY